jgi:hypothetical protein
MERFAYKRQEKSDTIYILDRQLGVDNGRVAWTRDIDIAVKIVNALNRLGDRQDE